jgi:hypothetical protein
MARSEAAKLASSKESLRVTAGERNGESMELAIIWPHSSCVEDLADVKYSRPWGLRYGRCS